MTIMCDSCVTWITAFVVLEFHAERECGGQTSIDIRAQGEKAPAPSAHLA
jgi:hypothetical protein